MNHYPRYLNLNITARGRLAALKADAEKLNAKPYRAMPEKTYTWQDMRYSGFHNVDANCSTLSAGMDGTAPIYYTHTGPAFPRERFADECENVNIDHHGWFADMDGQEKIRGFVVALPHGRFMAGYWSSCNGERVYHAQLCDDERDAAHTADELAQAVAESELEHNERWNSARDLESENEQNAQRLRECLALRNNPCFTRLRNEAAELIERIREIRETLKTEYADVL